MELQREKGKGELDDYAYRSRVGLDYVRVDDWRAIYRRVFSRTFWGHLLQLSTELPLSTRARELAQLGNSGSWMDDTGRLIFDIWIFF